MTAPATRAALSALSTPVATSWSSEARSTFTKDEGETTDPGNSTVLLSPGFPLA